MEIYFSLKTQGSLWKLTSWNFIGKKTAWTISYQTYYRSDVVISGLPGWKFWRMECSLQGNMRSIRSLTFIVDCIVVPCWISKVMVLRNHTIRPTWYKSPTSEQHREFKRGWYMSIDFYYIYVRVAQIFQWLTFRIYNLERFSPSD